MFPFFEDMNRCCICPGTSSACICPRTEKGWDWHVHTLPLQSGFSKRLNALPLFCQWVADDSAQPGMRCPTQVSLGSLGFPSTKQSAHWVFVSPGLDAEIVASGTYCATCVSTYVPTATCSYHCHPPPPASPQNGSVCGPCPADHASPVL